MANNLYMLTCQKPTLGGTFSLFVVAKDSDAALTLALAPNANIDVKGRDLLPKGYGINRVTDLFTLKNGDIRVTCIDQPELWFRTAVKAYGRKSLGIRDLSEPGYVLRTEVTQLNIGDDTEELGPFEVISMPEGSTLTLKAKLEKMRQVDPNRYVFYVLHILTQNYLEEHPAKAALQVDHMYEQFRKEYDGVVRHKPQSGLYGPKTIAAIKEKVYPDGSFRHVSA